MNKLIYKKAADEHWIHFGFVINRYLLGIEWQFEKCLSGQYAFELSFHLPFFVFIYQKIHNGV